MSFPYTFKEPGQRIAIIPPGHICILVPNELLSGPNAAIASIIQNAYPTHVFERRQSPSAERTDVLAASPFVRPVASEANRQL